MKIQRIYFYLLLLTLFSVCIHSSYAQVGVVNINQSEEIDRLLKLKKEVNKEATNYKIQIYNGTRSSANKTRTEFIQTFNEWPVKMIFETPNYKIWVGDFKTRLEADRALLKIKKKFHNAFIFKPKKQTDK